MDATNQSPERPWATGVLVMSGAISLSFNVVHSLHTSLAPPLALLYGGGPVMLAAMQSHVVAIQAARGELVGGWRKAFTFGLVIGALALSFLGIYDLLNHMVTDPIKATKGWNEPAILTPIVVDLMAIAALHELLRPAKTAVVETIPAVTPVVAPVADPTRLMTNLTALATTETTTPATTPTTARQAVVTDGLGGLSTTGRPPVEANGAGGLPKAGHSGRSVTTTPPTTANDHRSTSTERPVTTTPNDHHSDRSSTTETTAPPTTPKTTSTTGRKNSGRPGNDKKTSRPTAEENAEAVTRYLKSVAAGDPLSDRDLANLYGRSKGWGRDRKIEAGPQLVGHPKRPVDHEPNDHRNDRSEDNDHPAGDRPNDHLGEAKEALG